jgi:hypothetical protein
MASASQMTMHSGSSCAQDRRRGGRKGAKEGPTEPGGGDDGDSGDSRPVDDSGERTECGMAAGAMRLARLGVDASCRINSVATLMRDRMDRALLQLLCGW